MGEVLLTIAVGAVCGYILFRLKFPSGFIVGAIIGVAVLSIGFEAASFPVWARTLAQITAGAFIGCSVDKESLRGLRRILRPLALLLGFYLVLNLLVGFLFVRITSMDLMTCLMCSVPGGMTDIPIIAADMGANVPYVAVLQFARMVTGVGIFPLVIARFARQDGLLAEGGRALLDSGVPRPRGALPGGSCRPPSRQDPSPRPGGAAYHGGGHPLRGAGEGAGHPRRNHPVFHRQRPGPQAHHRQGLHSPLA